MHSWGNCTAETLVTNNFSSYNPIRYRGYYYDRETTLYYLNARYYDPSWRRFISPDHVSSLNPSAANGLNLYSYANNNPVSIAYNSNSYLNYKNESTKHKVDFIGESVNSSSCPLIKFPKIDKIPLMIDLFASLSGALSVAVWVAKNPEFYEFCYVASGASMHDVLINLKSPISRFASILSYGLVFYDTYTDVMSHINNGDTWQKTTASGLVKLGVGMINVLASAKIGAMVGVTIGGIPGFLIGTVAGVAAGVFVNLIFYTEINGDSIAGHLEDGIEWILELI